MNSCCMPMLLSFWEEREQPVLNFKSLNVIELRLNDCRKRTRKEIPAARVVCRVRANDPKLATTYPKKDYLEPVKRNSFCNTKLYHNRFSVLMDDSVSDEFDIETV